MPVQNATVLSIKLWVASCTDSLRQRLASSLELGLQRLHLQTLLNLPVFCFALATTWGHWCLIYLLAKVCLGEEELMVVFLISGCPWKISPRQWGEAMAETPVGPTTVPHVRTGAPQVSGEGCRDCPLPHSFLHSGSCSRGFLFWSCVGTNSSWWWLIKQMLFFT